MNKHSFPIGNNPIRFQKLHPTNKICGFKNKKCKDHPESTSRGIEKGYCFFFFFFRKKGREGRERKGKERKGKERKGREGKGREGVQTNDKCSTNNPQNKVPNVEDNQEFSIKSVRRS